ncbi:uncharacterized protein [Diadema setosum]|uniref:uncharacterized protein n=1 Tax=Diadema setosum TaxID=31175 RepID=UPI003B3A03BB
MSSNATTKSPEEPTAPSLLEWQQCCSEGSNLTCDVTTLTAFSSCERLLSSQALEILVWLVGVFSFVGNAFVIIFRCRQYRSLNTRLARVDAIIILSLAAADILNGIFLLFIAGADLRFRGQYYQFVDSWLGSTLCSIVGFIATLSSEISVLMLTLISIDRLLAIKFPFDRNRHLGIRSAIIAILALWCAATLICCIPFMFPMTFRGFYGNSDVCVGLPIALYIYSPPGTELEIEGPVWILGTAIYLGLNFVCLCVIFGCYVTIFISIKRSANRSQRSQDRSGEIQLAGKMAVIVGTDFFAWFPVLVMFLVVLAIAWSMPRILYATIVVFLLPLNSAVNPYVYTIMHVIDKRRNPTDPFNTQFVTPPHPFPLVAARRRPYLYTCRKNHRNLLAHLGASLRTSEAGQTLVGLTGSGLARQAGLRNLGVMKSLSNVEALSIPSGQAVLKKRALLWHISDSFSEVTVSRAEFSFLSGTLNATTYHYQKTVSVQISVEQNTSPKYLGLYSWSDKDEARFTNKCFNFRMHYYSPITLKRGGEQCVVAFSSTPRKQSSTLASRHGNRCLRIGNAFNCCSYEFEDESRIHNFDNNVEKCLAGSERGPMEVVYKMIHDDDEDDDDDEKDDDL